MPTKKTYKRHIFRRLLVLIIALAALYALFVGWQSWRSPEQVSSSASSDTMATLNDVPAIEQIHSWYAVDGLSKAEINRRLPSSMQVLVLGQDINANGRAGHVLILREGALPPLHTELADVGYEHVISGLLLFEYERRTLHLELSVDPQAMRNRHGVPIVEQIPAEHGYALLLSSFEHQSLYDQPVTLFEIVLLNSAGLPVSDELILYRDPSDGFYKATNTFMQPH